MDEPCSALDPTSTRRIEETMPSCASEVTIVIVTHNMQQAQRVSSHCAFFLAGENEPGRHRRGRPDRADLRAARSTRAPPTTCTGGSDDARVAASPRSCSSAARCLLVSAGGAAGRRPDHHRGRLDLGADRARPVARRRRAPGHQHQLPGRRLDRRAAVLHHRPGRLRGLRDPVPARRGARSCRASTAAYQYLPDVAGGTAFMYNLKDAAGHQITNLRLSASTIAKIFTGQDHELGRPGDRGRQPGAAPSRNQHLTPVIRSDGSGTSAKLADYLAHRSRPTGTRSPAVQRHPAGAVLAELPGRGRRARVGRRRQLRRQHVGRAGLDRLRRGRLRLRALDGAGVHQERERQLRGAVVRQRRDRAQARHAQPAT